MKVQTGPYKTVLKIVPEIDDKISLGSNNFLGRLYKKKTFKTVRDIKQILKSSPIQNSPQYHLSFFTLIFWRRHEIIGDKHRVKKRSKVDLI